MSDLALADAVQRKLSDGDGGAYLRNKQYSKEAPNGYITKLDPDEHANFAAWVQASGIPYDPSPTADYDLPGFWKSLVAGQALDMGINPDDQRMHLTDEFKTPYHQSFSNGSKWATPDAPRWINEHQLADKSGRVIFDERKR